MENIYYTGVGDDGTTVIGGKRLPKNDPLICCIGEIDELISSIGFLRSQISDERLQSQLISIQDILFSINSEIAAIVEPKFSPKKKMSEADLSSLEAATRAVGELMPKITLFVLPGGTSPSAAADLSRSVCRRAERSFFSFCGSYSLSGERISIAKKYINRLSSYLFWLGRYLCFSEHVEEAHPTG